MDDRVGIAHRERRVKKLRIFELAEDWIPGEPPTDPYFTLNAEDGITAEVTEITFPTFWDYAQKKWLGFPMYHGVGRMPWEQIVEGEYAGGTTVWCTRRHDHWEIVSGMFAPFAWGAANADIPSMSAGVNNFSIWWTTTDPGPPRVWTMTDSGYDIDVFNFGGATILAGTKGLVNYHAGENKWTTFGF
jgi:hypothetical protein